MADVVDVGDSTRMLSAKLARVEITLADPGYCGDGASGRL